MLSPKRNASNNYREYTEEDVRTLKEIRMFRKLDVSIEDIRETLEGRIPLDQLMQKHLEEYAQAMEHNDPDRLRALLAEGRLCKEKVDAV